MPTGKDFSFCISGSSKAFGSRKKSRTISSGVPAPEEFIAHDEGRYAEDAVLDGPLGVPEKF